MTHYIALIHKDPDSCYGISFPDVPGVYTAGDTIDEAIQQAAEVLEFASEDWTNPDGTTELPAARTIDQLRNDLEFNELAEGAIIAAIPFRVRAHRRRIGLYALRHGTGALMSCFRSPPQIACMPPIISVSNLTKTYKSGFTALKNISLDIQPGEIFALLGPNGAGKTTLISVICGLAMASEGTVTVAGHDNVTDYRAARQMIGLVPQELHTDAWETPLATAAFSRGLFGKPKDSAHIEKLLKDLSLWDKRKSQIITLSGGMKRRVMIAKALAHEPQILFLDEPTAGVDVELRKSMWQLVRELREKGVTIILTTHYIEEAEEMADRVGVINKGEIVLVEDKASLMQKLGRKQLKLHLQDRVATISSVPRSL